MADLYPAPFPNLIRRAFHELEREQKIFDLPASGFFHGSPELDTSVTFHGQSAATPVGPAAGPHDQLAQNIVLCWLGGSRIIELKTIQVKDQLQIPRPCIDAANVGYNVEWSQELRLDQSLREYVAASMLLDMMRASNLLGQESDRMKQDTILDMSVGYDLAGIRSDRVRHWIESMKDATKIVEALRGEIPDPFRRFRDLPFQTRISNTITLSTFHGCPADEIERIVHFLLTELDVHTTIKMNPTLLGREEVEYLLHDCLGYHDIRVTQEAFDKDLQFEEALDICRRLDITARKLGKKLAVKFSNTLVVTNHKTFFQDPVMYMSGAPLHVLTMNLVKKFRQRMGDEIPISFSAGIDQFNFPAAVGLNLVPVTTCTDLLKPGGYARLHKYMKNLESRMRALGVRTIGDYILKMDDKWEEAVRFSLQPALRAAYETAATLAPEDFKALWDFLEGVQKELLEHLSGGRVMVQDRCLRHASEFELRLAGKLPEKLHRRIHQHLCSAYGRMVNRAGLLNTGPAVDRTTADLRYRAAKHSSQPKKIGSRLHLYDCINCDKCVPVCPNDANFVYALEPVEVEIPTYEIGPTGIRQTGSEVFRIEESHQLANFADFCNECGNCDIFCPEDGGPYIEKPRFFASMETWRKHNRHDGFHVSLGDGENLMMGRLRGSEFQLVVDHRQKNWRFTGRVVQCLFTGDAAVPQEFRLLEPAAVGQTVDLRAYWIMKTLYRGIMDVSRINYLNILGVL